MMKSDFLGFSARWFRFSDAVYAIANADGARFSIQWSLAKFTLFVCIVICLER